MVCEASLVLIFTRIFYLSLTNALPDQGNAARPSQNIFVGPLMSLYPFR